MQDAWLDWGGDLLLDSTGDIALVLGTMVGQQRVIRRLLTNPGDYIWQPEYGAGLGALVGQPANAASIRALIRSQILQEASVAPIPQPVIDVQADATGGVIVTLQYVDAVTNATQVLSFPVSG